MLDEYPKMPPRELRPDWWVHIAGQGIDRWVQVRGMVPANAGHWGCSALAMAGHGRFAWTPTTVCPPRRRARTEQARPPRSQAGRTGPDEPQVWQPPSTSEGVLVIPSTRGIA